jgi:hypothetical protein
MERMTSTVTRFFGGVQQKMIFKLKLYVNNNFYAISVNM